MKKIEFLLQLSNFSFKKFHLVFRIAIQYLKDNVNIVFNDVLRDDTAIIYLDTMLLSS